MRRAEPVPDGWTEPVAPFLDSLRIKGRSQATTANYSASLNVAARYFAGRACFGWQDVTGTHVQSLAGYLLRKGYSRHSVVAFGVAIRGLLRHMGRYHQAAEAPVRLGAYTRKRSPCRLEPEQARALIETAADPMERAFLAVLYGAGLRISEALALTVRQAREMVTKAQGIIMGKGRIERLAIIGQPAATDLAAYLAVRSPDAPGLWARGARPLSEDAARALVVAAGHRIGLHVLPHDLRHAFARHVYRGIGENIDAPGDVGLDLVRRLMGHSRPDTTCLYLDASAGADPDLFRAIAHHPGAR